MIMFVMMAVYVVVLLAAVALGIMIGIKTPATIDATLVVSDN